MKKEQLMLYAVTNRMWVGKWSLEEQVEAALRGGVTCLQLREKGLSEKELIREAKRILPITRRYQVPCIVNDSVEAALACGADGVHLGQGDMSAVEARKRLGPDKIIGVSARTVEQAVLAQQMGADYLGAGAVFATSTKEDARPMERETLRAITAAVSIPVVAIGGITQQNLPRLSGTGVAGAALVSAIFGASDIEEAVRQLKKTVKQMLEEEA